MRLRVDRMCKVWQRGDTTWTWRCSVCTSEVLVFTGTAVSWALAYTQADHHIRSHATALEVGRTASVAVLPQQRERGSGQAGRRAMTTWPQIGTAAVPSAAA
jgi:hypothetical protein